MSDVGQAVVAGVRDLLPVLRERAQETEDARDVPADSVKALAETGFFRLLQPAAFGGYEAEPFTFLTAVAHCLPPSRALRWLREAGPRRRAERRVGPSGP